MATVHTTNLKGPLLIRRGKVRDLYDLGDRLLMVATDRISAFDVVMNEAIPDKGALLTSISTYWFDRMSDIVPHHLLSTDVGEVEALTSDDQEIARHRSMIVRRTRPLPVECVVRGYLAGSGWKEYQHDGTVCGIALPAGLVQSSALPEPIFTPATKAEEGHDQNISFAGVVNAVGEERAVQLRDLSLRLYAAAAKDVAGKGLILADTKFEFGVTEDGELLLIDEVCTPDSSRYWAASTYQPGQAQENFDKQILRDWLETTDWNKQPPPPSLPDHVVSGTRSKYIEAFERITGERWQ
jgi:phosphoribosylaminoimidazole-succinocarboxamide synthase